MLVDHRTNCRRGGLNRSVGCVVSVTLCPGARSAVEKAGL